MTHFHFDMGYSESTFSKYAFGRGGGGHKKEYAVYARENDDNYGRPLISFENKTLPISTSESLIYLQQTGLLSSNDFDIKKF